MLSKYEINFINLISKNDKTRQKLIEQKLEEKKKIEIKQEKEDKKTRQRLKNMFK